MKQNRHQGSSLSMKGNGYQSDDDNVRYKINTKYLNNAKTKTTKKAEPEVRVEEDENIRYMFPIAVKKTKSPEKKPKPKSRIKVNFWSNKQNVKRLHNTVPVKKNSNRRHTLGTISEVSPKAKAKSTVVKVRKRVSFLPSPLFSDNHAPMVTVPDDLTIQLNEEEVNDLSEDLNYAFVNNHSGISDTKSDNPHKKKAGSSMVQKSPKTKKKQYNDFQPQAPINDNDLEFFSKYVVQKLRRMETNQRIYSENLINTILMLGQLGKLNGKSKIADA